MRTLQILVTYSSIRTNLGLCLAYFYVHFGLFLLALLSIVILVKRMCDAHLGLVLSLYHDCDLTTIRLRYDYDEKLTCSFFDRVESRRMEAGARDTS